MFNKKSFEKVESSIFNEKFNKSVDDYNLKNIPDTILKNFGIKSDNFLPEDVLGDNNRTYDKVVLIVIDAFGYSTFERYYQKSQFLSKIVEEGIVSKLTTQFPSTTTANITTLHTGIPVSESGIYEWFIYEPIIDDVYCPFQYKLAKDETLLDINAKNILPSETLIQKLNVPSYTFHYHPYNEGPFSKYMQKHCNSIGFENLDDGLKKLKGILQKEEKSYCYFYHSDFDTVSHEYGPNTKETDKCVLEIIKSFDNFFESIKTLNLKNTLFLLTADHGQTTVVKENAVYINKEYPEILPYIKKNKSGEYIIPCGSFRDMFLHVDNEGIDFVSSFLKEKLIDKAEVYLVSELLKAGIFGNQKPSLKFLDRIGDIVILPYKDHAVWWYEENKFYIKHKGMHGGLLKEELEIPFLVYSIN